MKHCHPQVAVLTFRCWKRICSSS